MKLSSTLHLISAATGIVAALALLGAWLAGADGTVLGFNQVHLFEDSKTLFLASIASGLGTVIHQKIENKK